MHQREARSSRRRQDMKQWWECHLLVPSERSLHRLSSSQHHQLNLLPAADTLDLSSIVLNTHLYQRKPPRASWKRRISFQKPGWRAAVKDGWVLPWAGLADQRPWSTSRHNIYSYRSSERHLANINDNRDTKADHWRWIKLTIYNLTHFQFLSLIPSFPLMPLLIYPDRDRD